MSKHADRNARAVSRAERLDLREQIESAVPQTARLMRRAYEARFAELGISLKQAFIIGNLDVAAEHTMNQTEVATKAGLRKPATGLAIDTLVAMGFVYRTTDPADGRAKLVSLTDEGSALAEQVDRAFGEMAALLRHGTTAEERRMIVTMLSSMRRNLAATATPMDHELTEY